MLWMQILEEECSIRTVITYVDGGINDFFVEGILEGYILEEKQGTWFWI